MPRFRFDPDPNTLVKLYEKSSGDKVNYIGLVVDESKTGFCALFVRPENFTSGEIFVAELGSLNPLECEVRWSQKLDEKIFKTGFMYID